MKINLFDIFAYILLLLAIGVGAWAILKAHGEPGNQFLIVLVLVVFYLLWGVVYHHVKRDLSRKLFLEYLIIGAIALVSGLLVFFN